MASVAISPSAAAKLKNKSCVNRMKNGSPKLQEVLRQRCRERMKNQRTKLFNRNRFGLELNCKLIQDSLTEIVREEFSNMSTSGWKESDNDSVSPNNELLTPEQALQIENEILAQEEEWILEEYERMLREEEESSREEALDIVFCPICQKTSLTEEMTYIMCRMCGARFSNCSNLKEMGHLLNICVNNHAQICNKTPDFMLLPENDRICLHMMCLACSRLELVI